MKIIRRNIAFSLDWRGPDDDQMTWLFKGATKECLDKVFSILCAGGNGVFKSYEINQRHDIVHLFRHCYFRLEVTIHDYNPSFLSLSDFAHFIASKLQQEAHGNIDFYLIDDFLNLTDRKTDAIETAWKTIRTLSLNQLQKSVASVSTAGKSQTPKKQKCMPKIYVRVPSLVAGYFRGKNEDCQIENEFEPYEFADHDDLHRFLEHNLRFIPEQNQSVYCLSERAFNNMLYGKPPEGGRQILQRDPSTWLTMSEICVLTNKFVTDKIDAADYLCIAIPKEILDNGRIRRTNGSYALPKKEAERFIAYLRQEFKREFEAFCEVDEDTCRRNGINRSDVDRMERFLANYNVPVCIDGKERETLRKQMFRMKKRKGLQPYIGHQLDPFATHISTDDEEKAGRKQVIIKREKTRNEKRKVKGV